MKREDKMNNKLYVLLLALCSILFCANNIKANDALNSLLEINEAYLPKGTECWFLNLEITTNFKEYFSEPSKEYVEIEYSRTYYKYKSSVFEYLYDSDGICIVENENKIVMLRDVPDSVRFDIKTQMSWLLADTLLQEDAYDIQALNDSVIYIIILSKNFSLGEMTKIRYVHEQQKMKSYCITYTEHPTVESVNIKWLSQEKKQNPNKHIVNQFIKNNIVNGELRGQFDDYILYDDRRAK